MREIKYIVLHCTASPQTQTVQAILSYWKNNLKWKTVGYHHLLDSQGTVHNLQPIELPTNGVKGYNSNSIHISYIGGVDNQGKAVDNRTPEQIASQIKLLKHYKNMFPNAKILGHRDFPKVAKECPSFDVEEWLKTINLNEE